MNNIKTKILWHWVSWSFIFIIVLLATLISPSSIRLWGIVICLLYWIGIIVVYIREYNGLKNAVSKRFPSVFEEMFNTSKDYKNKFIKLENWDTNPITKEMYGEDLNIKNRILKLNELDFFKNIVFACVVIVLIVTAIKFG